jgi:tetratricopeptide (TPR) repeat protein
LLIIDNADDPDVFFPRGFNGDQSSPPRARHNQDGKNAALAQFIPQCTCGNGAVLFTTRNKQAGLKLSASFASLIEVDQMNEHESVEMIRALVGNNQISDEIASRLSNRLEKLPLAIAQASAFIQENSMSAGDYLERLERDDEDVVCLLSEDFRTVGRDDDVPPAVMLTFAISFEQIESEQPLATEILSLIAFFDRQAIPQSLVNDGLVEPWFEEFEYYRSNRAYFDTKKGLKDVGDDENWYNEAEGSLGASNRNGKDRESEDVAEDFNNVRSAGPVDPGDSGTDYYPATERDRETLSNSGTSYYNPTCLFSSTQNKETSQACNVTTTPYLRKITRPEDHSSRRSIDEFQLQKAIGKLKAFSIVSQGENKDIGVHRLVQLATRHWLRRRGSDRKFAEKALRAIAQAFPFPRYAQLRACQSLLPHAKEILKNKASSSDTYEVALLRAILSENLAHFFFDCGRVELRSMARDEWLQATLGEGHPLLTARKVLQAGILTTAGQAQETTKMISRALFLQRHVDPDNLGCILFLKDQLAGALTAERRFKEAIKLLTSALRQCEGRNDLRGIRIQLSIRLGWTFKEINKLQRAEEILAKTAEEHTANPAPQVHEAEAAQEYKAEHPQMLACSVRLAQVLMMQNRLLEAELLCRRCLLQDQDVQLNISARGPLADAEHQLSLCLLRQGRLKEAESSIRQLLQISTDGDNMFVTYKETLCIVLEKQDRWQEAERTREEVLRLLEGRFEQNHPEVLRNKYWLSLAQRQVGKIRDARELMGETLNSHQRVFGKDDARTRRCLKAVEEMRGASGSDNR